MARVIAVEKPMQYSVSRTSLSMVLGIAITFTPSLIQARRVAQRIVAADGDQIIELQLLQFFSTCELMSQVVPVLGKAVRRPKTAAAAFIFDGLVRLECSIVPPERSMVRVLARFERQNVTLPAGRIVEIEVRQTFPAAADADDFAIVLRAAIDHSFDD